ncbi:hypothetical protein [Nonomuraea typhae]|uniref:hypothetical protein n=1 Tax=Nonomuraea typhae TaxID=2603600 RepID=UPI0012F70E17|nr:hypothetical protein [Nonomuraea typhae]
MTATRHLGDDHPLAAALDAYRRRQQHHHDQDMAILARLGGELREVLTRIDLTPVGGICADAAESVSALIADLVSDSDDDGRELTRRVWVQNQRGHLRILTGTAATPIWRARLSTDFGPEWRELTTDDDLLAAIGKALMHDPWNDDEQPDPPPTHYELATAVLSPTRLSNEPALSLDVAEICDTLTALTHAVLAVVEQIAAGRSA